jgi:hypothetical protein
MIKGTSGLSFFLIFINVQVLSQGLTSNTGGRVSYVHKIEDRVYVQTRNTGSKKKLFVNNVAIDSSALRFEEFIILNHSKKVFGYNISGDHTKVCFYSIENNFLRKEAEIEKITILSNQCLLSDNILASRSTKIYLINPVSWTVVELVDISKYSGSYEILEVIVSPGNNLLLVEYGNDIDGGRDVYGYLVYDLSARKIEDRTQAFQSILPPKGNIGISWGFSGLITSVDNKYLFANTDRSLSGDQEDEIILDSAFDFVAQALAKDIYVKGRNIANGKTVSYNVSSEIEQGQVILEYFSKFELESAFHKIYYNSALSEGDLKGLKKPELELLKNFVFAKHNYKFDNEYYQAYFNLFEFYNAEEKRLSRTKEVNHLLTEADKKNLALLTRALSK